MKISVGGEIESSLYDQFRVARNMVQRELENFQLEIEDVKELSFYIFLLKDFETSIQNKYIKRYKRVEIEIVILFSTFKEADECKRVGIIKSCIIESMHNFQNKNINQSSIDLIKNEVINLLSRL